MFIICTELPIAPIIIQRKVPTAHMIAFHIHLIPPGSAVSPGLGQENFGIILQSMRHLVHSLFPLTVFQREGMLRSSELSRHQHTDFSFQRKPFLVSHLEHQLLAVIKNVLHVSLMVCPRKITLPTVVRKTSVSDIAFKSKPSLRSRHRIIIRNLCPYLRNRSRIVSFHHSAAAQQRVLPQRIAFLVPDTQIKNSPRKVCISLLHDKFGRTVHGRSQIQPGSNPPTMIKRFTISKPRTQISTVRFLARQTVPIGRKPQRCIISGTDIRRGLDTISQRRVGLCSTSQSRQRTPQQNLYAQSVHSDMIFISF